MKGVVKRTFGVKGTFNRAMLHEENFYDVEGVYKATIL